MRNKYRFEIPIAEEETGVTEETRYDYDDDIRRRLNDARNAFNREADGGGY